MNWDKYLEKISIQYKINKVLYDKFDKFYTSQGKKQYKSVIDDGAPIQKFNKVLQVPVNKYKRFLDICSNPNTHANTILNQNKKLVGTGISLHPDKGGYKIGKDILRHKDRYNVQWFDVINDDITTIDKTPIDYALMSCFVNHNRESKNDPNLNMKLQERGLRIVLDRLEKGGDFTLLLTFNFNAVFLLNILCVLSKAFVNIRLYKSKEIYADLAIVYIHCVDFKGEVPVETLKKIRNNEIVFDESFVNKSVKYIDYIFERVNIGYIESMKSEKYTRDDTSKKSDTGSNIKNSEEDSDDKNKTDS